MHPLSISVCVNDTEPLEGAELAPFDLALLQKSKEVTCKIASCPFKQHQPAGA